MFSVTYRFVRLVKIYRKTILHVTIYLPPLLIPFFHNTCIFLGVFAFRKLYILSAFCCLSIYHQKGLSTLKILLTSQK